MSSLSNSEAISGISIQYYLLNAQELKELMQDTLITQILHLGYRQDGILEPFNWCDKRLEKIHQQEQIEADATASEKDKVSWLQVPWSTIDKMNLPSASISTISLVSLLTRLINNYTIYSLKAKVREAAQVQVMIWEEMHHNKSHR